MSGVCQGQASGKQLGSSRLPRSSRGQQSRVRGLFRQKREKLWQHMIRLNSRAFLVKSEVCQCHRENSQRQYFCSLCQNVYIQLWSFFIAFYVFIGLFFGLLQATI